MLIPPKPLATAIWTVALVAGSLLVVDRAGVSAKAVPLSPGVPRQDCVKSGCHEKFQTFTVTHKPIKDGSCEACHEATDEKNHKFKLTSDEPGLCTECHDKVLQNLPYLHGPVAGGSCTACHNPHGSDREKVLLKAPSELCAECHESIKEQMAGKAHKHKPATDDCTYCHSAHGGATKMFTKAAAPEMCLECHDALGDTIAKAAIPHDAVKSGRSCLGCHDPHASALDALLVKPSMELCLSCHDRELPTGKGKIMNIAELLKTHPDHHGPIRQKDCVSCHSDMHGGSRFRLLTEAYPEKFYSPFDEKLYALCFQCHEADLAKVERTKDLTGFRNGDQNLHFVHVNKATKGRTCRACHETHASVRPVHIRESVPFGSSNWALPINFKKADNGGSCAPGCHRVYGYDRGTPVSNFPPPGGVPPAPAPAPAKTEEPPKKEEGSPVPAGGAEGEKKAP